MTNETVIYAHDHYIASATFAMYKALYQAGTEYEQREISEIDPVTGEINEQVILIWQKDRYIMAEPKQETPQAEPQPDTSTPEAESKPTVSAIADVLYADPQARIKELEAALAKSQEKHKRAETVIKSMADTIKKEVAKNTALYKENEELRAKLKVSPDTEIGKQEAEIERLKAQVKELQLQLQEKYAEHRLQPIGVYKIMAEQARVDGVEGQILFKYPPGYIPAETDTNGVQSVSGTIVDSVAATPFGDAEYDHAVINATKVLASTFYNRSMELKKQRTLFND